MDVAIVTGAASGIGLAVSRKLVDVGCRVYGLGGNYADTPYSHEYFIPTPCELTQIESIKEKVEEILAKEGGIFILVNNAKYFGTKPFLEEVNLAEFETVLKVNLLCPLLLTRLALPSLERLQGFVINIASGSPESARGGPAGASAAGGLRWMGESLFEECRGSGVKVTTIFPQANRSGPAQGGRQAESSTQTIIDPEAVAQAVERVVRESDGNVITEIVIRPQRLTEKPIPAPLHIPFPAIPKEITPDRPLPTLRALAETEEAISSAAKKARNASKERLPKRPKGVAAKQTDDAGVAKRKTSDRKSTRSQPGARKTEEQTPDIKLKRPPELKVAGETPAKGATGKGTKPVPRKGAGETAKRKSADSAKRKSPARKRSPSQAAPIATSTSAKSETAPQETTPSSQTAHRPLRSRRNKSPVPRTHRRITPGPSS